MFYFLPINRALGRALLLSFPIWAATLPDAIAAESAGGEVVQLPAFVVEDRDIPPHWFHAELPGMEILSCLSRGDTTNFLNEIARQTGLYSLYLPPELRPSVAGPLVVLLDARELTSLRLPLDSNKAPGKGRGRTVGTGIPRWDFASLYHQASQAAPALGSFMIYGASSSIVFQQPGWTALGEIFSAAGANLTAMGDGVDIYHPAQVRVEKELPLPSLATLFTERSSASADTPKVAGRDELNTWFGRWVMLAEEGRHREAWWKFIREKATRPEMNDEIARNYFGLSLKELEARVERFRKDAFAKARVHLKITPALPVSRTGPLAARLRDATEIEVAGALVQWTLLAWREHSDLRVPLRDAARRLLDRALKNTPGNARLVALRGLVELMEKNISEAQRLLESVATSATLNPGARFELAKLRYADAAAEADAAGAKFNATQVEAVTGLLGPFLQSPPNEPRAFDLIVTTWQRAATKPPREDVLRLVAAVRRFPSEVQLVSSAVELCLDSQLVSEARELAELGLVAAKSEAVRVRFQTLIERARAVSP